MFKEKIVNHYEELNALLEKVKKIVYLWKELGTNDRTSTGLDVADVRHEEERIVPELIQFIKDNPILIKERREEIKFIVSEYLVMGDNGKLMQEIAFLLGIGFQDTFDAMLNGRKEGAVGPMGAVEQVLGEIEGDIKPGGAKTLN